MPEGNRFFKVGEKVKVVGKSHVIDKARDNEGLAPEDRTPIEEDVTGYEGEVCAQPYESPMKDGGECIPIRLPNDAVIGVPSERIERTSVLAGSGQKSSFAMMSPPTMEERELGTRFAEYQREKTVAQLDHLPFPSFPEWLEVRQKFPAPSGDTNPKHEEEEE